MLSRNYRFHSRGGVNATYQKGKTIRTPKMSLVFAKNSRGFTRFGVVISKKIIKSAVGRNRVRRRVYEAIRAEFNQIPLRHDYLFVVFSSSIKEMPFSELRQLIASLVRESVIQSNK